MKQSYRYFKNEQCEYIPCHPVQNADEFNCLFCYCPMYRMRTCLGSPQYIQTASGATIKDCSNCTYPHEPEHYDAIMKFLADHP